MEEKTKEDGIRYELKKETYVVEKTEDGKI
jgi:hypothetical protein